jgi:uncharacterized protein YeaO (DUF488 family)
MADLHIKRVYEAPSPDDGSRVLVDRLWPRGLSKQKAKLTLWLKDVAPTPELRKWFNHEPARLQEFDNRYRDELAHNPAIGQLRLLLKTGKVTLLYAARDPACNHAMILADYLRKNVRDE